MEEGEGMLLLQIWSSYVVVTSPAVSTRRESRRESRHEMSTLSPEHAIGRRI